MPVALLILVLLLLCLLIRKVSEFQPEVRSEAMRRYAEGGYEGPDDADRESEKRLIQQLCEFERRLGFELSQPVKDWLLGADGALDAASKLDDDAIRAIQEPFSKEYYHVVTDDELVEWDSSRADSNHPLGVTFREPIHGCLFYDECGCGAYRMVVVNPPELAGYLVEFGASPVFFSGSLPGSAQTW